jgi:2'-hydroxyisoflavone reductase
MKLLVIGGTRHVGRSVVEVALARGDDVTALNRGLTRDPAPGVRTLTADRTDPAALREALSGGEWDAVIDTWSLAPRVVRDSCALLADQVGHYGYVSSRSVYRSPVAPGADENFPVVDGSADSDESGDYAADKRGGELAVLGAFGPAALVARPGLILGPYEDIGRMPWWFSRVERGGRTLAPGPADLPLQYIDARDLAAWMLTAADRGLGGTFNTVSRSGHTTMGRLLETAVAVTGSNAELVWATPGQIEQAGIGAWTELPIWLPPDSEHIGLHLGDVTAAYAQGLTCRPVQETLADTWAWIQAEGYPVSRPGRPAPGLDPGKERKLLEQIG